MLTEQEPMHPNLEAYQKERRAAIRVRPWDSNGKFVKSFLGSMSSHAFSTFDLILNVWTTKDPFLTCACCGCGQGCPCHLYLDLEYLKSPNPAADPEAMMAALLDLLQRALHDQLGQRLLRDALIELDSSTDGETKQI
jgi:hypothetical protein